MQRDRFQNDSEAIRAGLRLLDEEETKVIDLKTAIEEGIDSGDQKSPKEENGAM